MVEWESVVAEAEWRSIHDVRVDNLSWNLAPAVLRLPREIVVTVFNVKGNEYRLLTYVDYASQFVQALDLLTHAEYDKEQWKRRY